MRKSKILSKLRTGQVARICALGAPIPYYPAIASHFRFDGVFLDGEHRRWGTQVIESALHMHRMSDIDCIVRAPTLEKIALYRLLEDGASGLIVPHVSTPEKAQELVQAVKFPPLGDRGFDGAGLDAGFLVECPEDYIDQANQQTMLIVQIETPLAIENVDSIAAVPGVDVLFLGPGDLSLRLGCKPNVDDPILIKAEEKVAQAAARHGIAWGRPVGDVDELRKLLELNAQFVVFGGDFGAIHNHLAEKASQFDELLAVN